MTSRRALEMIILCALILFPMGVSAQSLHLVTQEGTVSASALVSGPTGSASDNDSTSAASVGSMDIFAGAGASLPEIFASGTAHLQTSFEPRSITLSAMLDGNGSATFPDLQVAGGSGGANLTILFTVDASMLARFVGETFGVWTGDAGIEPGISLYSSHNLLADINGTGGRIEFEGVLVPGETYTLSAYGIASAVTSEFDSFGSAQGGFSARLELQAAAVPEPGTVPLLAGILLIWTFSVKRYRSDTDTGGDTAGHDLPIQIAPGRLSETGA